MTKVIRLEGPLDHEQGERVAAAIRNADDLVHLLINSPGGHFGALIEICLEIEEAVHPVITSVTGEASSAAAMVAISGDRRRISSKGSMMVHFSSLPAGMTRSPDEAAKSAAECFRIVCEHVTADPADVRKWMQSERVLDAREALAAGFVDQISDSPLPVFLRPLRKRPPTIWLRRWRETCELLDLRRPAIA